MQRVQEEADRWFARLMAPDCDAREREMFERWRGMPGHERAYAQSERLWRRFGAPDAAADPRLRALRERTLTRTALASSDAAAVAAENPGLREVLAALPPRARQAPARRRRPGWPIAIAAGLCAIAFVAGLRFMDRAAPDILYASTDALRDIRLEDGTRMQMDVDTEVAVRYAAHGRAVTLRHGRTLFDVTHDAGRPFTVDLGDSKVTVLGTRFQALRDPDRISVTLQRGSLRLDGQAGSGTRSALLVPGEQVDYSLRDPSSWRKRSVDSSAALAWSRGRLVFRSTPLAEAVEEVNRYAHPKLRLADASLAALPVSGNFIAGDSTLVASAWTATLPLRSETDGGEIVLRNAR